MNGSIQTYVAAQSRGIRVLDVTASADHLPTRWFNLLAHLPEPLSPVRDPDDGQGSRILLLRELRLRHLLAQDNLEEPWLDIPGEVLERYREIGRPTPLIRASNLERYLDTPARIFVKREDVLPTGSFKLNSSIPQAYYANEEGARALVTETGAGQWGHAVAYSCRLFGLRNLIFWAKVSERQKIHRRALIQMLGGRVLPSPSDQTEVGRAVLAKEPEALGSLGTAIGEAICYSRDHREFRYISGSNLPHVLLHQTVIGLETRSQLERLGHQPDVLVACVGGGSNLGGFMGPFLPDKMSRGTQLRLVAAEAASAPRLTRGQWCYDHSDPEGITPLAKSYTLGREYPLPETHVGGLRQHNGSPVIGLLRHRGLLDARAYEESKIFEVGRLFLRLEGIVPAPESCHALCAAIEEAERAKQDGRRRNIVLCLSGTGLLDLGGYIANLPELSGES